MSTIKLSLDSLQVLEKKTRWNLFFIVITDHPTDESQKLVGTFPTGGEQIQLKPETNNQYSFVAQGAKPGDGMELLSIQNPSVQSLDVQIYVKNKGALSKVADVLGTLKGQANAKDFESLPGFLGKAASWVSVQSKAITDIVNILEKMPDRAMGMVDMGLNFSELTTAAPVITRSNKTSTGEVEFTWTWETLA